MIKKINDLLGSIRFWQTLIAIVLLCLASYEIIPNNLANAIAGLLGISVAIGTADKAAKSIGGLTK
jgi:hypothetical protein